MARVVSLLTFLLCAAVARAESPAVSTEQAQDAGDPELDELEARLRKLEQVAPHEDEVRGPLSEARLALVRARQAALRGDSALRERATRIALAALSLSERRAALLRERALLRAAKQRRDVAYARLAAAKAALEQERKQVRDASRPSEGP